MDDTPSDGLRQFPDDLVSFTECGLVALTEISESATITIRRALTSAGLSDLAKSLRFAPLPQCHEYDLVAVGIPERIKWYDDDHARIVSNGRVTVPRPDLEAAFNLTPEDLQENGDVQLVVACTEHAVAFRRAHSTTVDGALLQELVDGAGGDDD